jgi:uncharacterized protein
MNTISSKIIVFVVLSYLIAWSVWMPLAINETITRPGVGWPTHMYGLLAPMISAVITVFLFEGKSGLARLIQKCVRWRVGLYWLSVIAVIVAAIVALIVTNTHFTLEELFIYSGIASSVGPLATFLLVLIINGFGEEVGWRGFLTDNLLSKYSLIKTSLIVFAIWATWHAPLFWVVESFRDFGVGGIIGWLFGILAGSILLTWLYRGANSSILLLSVWHTVFNFTSATEATAQTIAPITSTLVMLAVFVILTQDYFKHKQQKHNA